MPQIVKGGKYIFGWSKVGKNGRIVIPPEAVEEYGMTQYEKVILIPGSKRSGGFGLTSIELLKDSPIASLVQKDLRLAKFQSPEGNPIDINKKNYSWVKMEDNGIITVPLGTLKKFGIQPGDSLLVVRGSGLAIGFIVKGPIVEEARNHREIQLFE
jgi:bifunctional DNA-binding transcriptional regulator/antitoxin component of YhaV-PrlF toxin-antitoxin module